MDIVVGALRGTNVHLNLSKYPTCPRLWRDPPTQTGFSLPVHYDGMVNKLIDFLLLKKKIQYSVLFIFFQIHCVKNCQDVFLRKSIN